MLFASGIEETTTTAGTGTVTLTATNFGRFSAAFAVGDLVSYAIKSGNDWEWGIGTVGASNTLARTTVTASVVSGVYGTSSTPITLAGVSTVFCTPHAMTQGRAVAITHASLDTAAAANKLAIGEMYYLTDSRFAVATSTSEYDIYSKHKPSEFLFGSDRVALGQKPIVNARTLTANLSVVNSGAAWASYVDVGTAGQFDIVVPANIEDRVVAGFGGKLTTATSIGVRLSIWSMGGSTQRTWTDQTVAPSVDGGVIDVAGSTAITLPTYECVNTVRASDLDSNGNLVLRIRLINTSGSAGGTHTFNGTPSSGPVFRFCAVNERSDRLRVLSPETSGWEAASATLQEPVVWYDTTDYTWYMLYTGANGTHQLGIATAPHPLGPWTKYAGNPIAGGGVAGVAGSIARGEHWFESGVHYLYFSSGGSIKCLYGADVLGTLTLHGSAILAPDAATFSMENTSVCKVGSTYYMMFESKAAGGSGPWQLGLATGTSPLGPFTVTNYPLTTLQVATNASYSGAFLRHDGTNFQLVYHACYIANNSFPTAVYLAESADCITWSVVPNGILFPVPGHDQAADPYCVADDGQVYLFFTEQYNTTQSGGIDVAIPGAICDMSKILGAL